MKPSNILLCLDRAFTNGRSIVAVLSTAIGLNTAVAQGHNHAGLEFLGATTTYSLVDPAIPNATISVEWKPRATPGTVALAHKYVVKIVIPAANVGKPYSLLTLGLQGRVGPRKITCTKGHATLKYTPNENSTAWHGFLV